MAMATGLALGLAPAEPTHAHAGSFSMSASGARYGQNSAVVVRWGSLTQACDSWPTQAVSDIYVVATGTVAGTNGEILKDLGRDDGVPNRAIGNLTGFGFLDLTIGYTYPGGELQPGTYDIIEDACQDGQFNVGVDSIQQRAFTVRPPADPLAPPDPNSGQAIRALKNAAGTAAADLVSTATKWEWFWKIYDALPGVPAVIDGPGTVIVYFMNAAICVRLGPYLGTVCRVLLAQTPPGQAWTIRTGIQGLILKEARAYAGIAADPPDPNFTEPAPLEEIPDWTRGQSTDIDRAVERFYYAGQNETAAAEAFLHALEKYQGARDATDPVAALAQATAASAYARQAATAIEDKAAARAAMVEFENQQGGLISQTAAEFIELRERLANGGSLTAPEIALLESYGMDQAAQDEFAQMVIAEGIESYESLSALDAQARPLEQDLVQSFRDAAIMFDGFAATLREYLTSAGLASYPELTLSGPAQVAPGDQITVSATTTGIHTMIAWDTDADGDFDDATGAAASATANHLGRKVIGALVTDGYGHQTVSYHTTEVLYPSSHPLIAGANPPAGATVQATPGQVVDFQLTPGHTAALPVTVTWYISGEAAGSGNTISVAASQDVNPRYVEAQVTDQNGVAERTAWTLLTHLEVSPPEPEDPPNASFTFSPTDPKPGQTVTFSDTSVADPARTIKTWAWDFNADGVTDSTSPNPTRIFTAAGRIAVTLTVTDSAGAQDTASREIVVANPSYLSVYPVAGTATGSQVTVRVKAWESANWTELPGAKVRIEVGESVAEVATDAQGLAEARVPRMPGQPVTAYLVGATNGAYGPATDTHDLSTIGKPQGDVVFVVDESNTMGPYQDAVVANLNLIASGLAQSIDHQLGLVGFGSTSHAAQAPHTHVPATDSLADFAAAAASLERLGIDEWGTDAIAYALGSPMGVRPEAASCLVLVGDEKTQTRNTSVAQAAQALEDNDATLFAIINPRVDTAAYRDLAQNSGGAWFDIAEFVKNPAPVLTALTASCVATITQRPDLSVTVDDSLAQTPLDRPAVHAVVVSNGGEVTATGAELSLDLTGPVEVTAITGSGQAAPATEGGWRITWPAFELEPGDSATFTVTWAPSAEAAPGDVVTAVAQVHDDGASGADLFPANNQDSDNTALVAPAQQSVSVMYVDDDAAQAPVEPASGARRTVVGPRLTAVQFTEAEARAAVPQNYVFAGLDNVESFDDDDLAAQTITVHFRHHHTLWALTVRRTVSYAGAGDRTPAAVVQEVVWQADRDDVTQVTVYRANLGYPEVPSPATEGFTASQAVVTQTDPGGPTTVAPTDSVVTVTYVPATAAMPSPGGGSAALPLTGTSSGQFVPLVALMIAGGVILIWRRRVSHGGSR
ncbi:MAG: PKD domain-containing protein [Bifidobacteriaceae bacterium]|jgi:LPXTG-motif cell wall-anchored protein|nr:PKD domain-containing protein [Bifidobacteriaceae bacterium]